MDHPTRATALAVTSVSDTLSRFRFLRFRESGSYLRLIDCVSQLKAQGPSRTCNESKEEEEEGLGFGVLGGKHAAWEKPRNDIRP